jgi:hypothetical protein
MKTIGATKRTIDAIRKADALPNSLIPDADGRKSSSQYTSMESISYGNTYIGTIVGMVSPGVYKVDLENGSIGGVTTVTVSTFDVVYGNVFYAGQKIIVVDTMVISKSGTANE